MAGLLSIALFPIGFVAVVQTQGLAAKAESNAELALQSLTERAASVERQTLSRARGIAQTLSASILLVADDPELCSAMMGEIIARAPAFTFVGFIPTSGLLTCGSSGVPRDITEEPTYIELMTDQRPSVIVDRHAPISRASVVVVSEPVFGSEDPPDLRGFIAVSIPHDSLELIDRPEEREALVDLITFNNEGVVLTALNGLDTAQASLPRDVSPTALINGPRQAFTLEDQAGNSRIYTAATIEPGEVYALGVWDRTASVSGKSRGEVLTWLFPAIMWLAGLLVALVAVHRLVTRHLQVLGRQMALFTAARRLPATVGTSNPPTEIRRIQKAFQRMTDAIVRDEASLEDAVREKSVLVKEIHHRVKNNLQLISSIINMQIRQVTSPEAKTALRQTQERVLSMATIHRDLYQTNETGLVDVGHLVREVVTQTVEITPGIDDLEVTIDVEPIWLYPDQAVPMSLLASEAVINALKHMPGAETYDGQRWLTVTLTQDDDRTCTFRAENVATQRPPQDNAMRGMGRKLIKAFATQLSARVGTEETEDRYVLQVTFTASEFAPAPGTF